MQGGVPLLNTMTLPPGATSTQARLVFDGVRGAIFLYANGGPVGALIGSWAISAGTDPYGNPYPQGFNVSIGVIETGNMIINSLGIFLYSGTPAHGNLIYSNVTGGAGTDSFGNAYLAGETQYSGGTATSNLIPTGLNILNSGEITAANMIINTAGQFFYLGTPALNNLYASITSGSGTDAFGNPYVAGHAVYGGTTAAALLGTLPPQIVWYNLVSNAWTQGGTITQNGATVGLQMQIGNAPADLRLLNTQSLDFTTINVSNSGLLTTAGQDADVLVAGHAIHNVASLAVSSVTRTAYVTVPISAANYHYRVLAIITGNQAAGAPVFTEATTATTVLDVQHWRFITPGSPTTDATGVAFSVTDHIGQVLLNGAQQMYESEGWVEAISTGNLEFEVALGTAGDTFTINEVFVRIEQF